MILFTRCADSDVAIFRAAISGCSEPSRRFQDLGTLSQALLRKILKKFSKDFQNFNPTGFLILSLHCANFDVAVCRAANSGCSEPHSASGMSTTVVSLRYRIEMVQVS